MIWLKNSVLFLALVLTLFVSACDSNDDPGQCNVDFATEDLVIGDGTEAKVGRSLLVGYDGYFCDSEAPDLRGEEFQSTEGGEPFQFVLGAGTVIAGWDQGIQGMKEGGVRRITIPPDMAYGESGWRDIPPNATLVFDVELLEVQ